MEDIKSNITKEITMKNDIRINNKLVVSQTAVINSANPQSVRITKYNNDEDLYEENRVQIRELVNEFEEYAYAEKEALNNEDKND
jgi:hypothetical protein